MAAVALPLLTTSAAKKYRACPRAYYFGYELGARPIAHDPALRFGTLGHTGLEAWWLAAKADLRRVEWLDAALAAVREHEQTNPFELAKAEALMIGYHAAWADEPYEVLAVERQFRAPLINPETGAPSRTWMLGGKLDVVVRRGYDVLLVEHKTSSEDFSAGSEYRQRLILDSQVSNYFVGTRALGYQITGCLYDVIGKPGQRPLKATPPEDRKYTKPTKANPAPRLYAAQREHDETPEEYQARILAAIEADPQRYFQRFPIVRLAEEEREAAFDLWQTASQIRESRRAGAWPRNSNSCRMYGRACSFLEVCTGTASIDDATRFRRVENVNEELSEESREGATQ